MQTMPETETLIFSREATDEALACEPIRYTVLNGQKTNPFNGTTATLYLALREFCHPGDRTVADSVALQLRSLIAGGNEPDMDTGAQWSFADCAAAVTMARFVPTVWGQLTKDEVARLDLLMECLTVASAFGMNDCNHYRTTFGMYGNFCKDWNPNYRFTSTVPVLCAAKYFGSADAVDHLLLSFDYDETVERLGAAGFTNALINFRKAGKNLLEEGGDATLPNGADGGTGRGVRNRFTYRGYRADETAEILTELYEICYAGGKVVNEIYENGKRISYILSGKPSPMTGRDGMMLELDGGDGHGKRSSAAYCLADINLGMCALAVLTAVGAVDPATGFSPALREKITVGNEDVIFKMREGYMSHSLGGSYESHLGTYGGTTQVLDLWYAFLKPILTR